MNNERLLFDTNKVGLQWPVEPIMAQDEITARCISSVSEKKHTLLIDRYTQTDVDGRWHLIQHELCHFLLAEQVDTCMSCLTLPKDITQRQAMACFTIWAPIDIWVDQIAHRIWPIEQKAGFLKTLSEAALIAKSKPMLIDNNAELIISMSLFRAEKEIFGFDEIDLRPIMRGLCPQTHDIVKRLTTAITAMAKDAPSVEALSLHMRNFAMVWGVDEFKTVSMVLSIPGESIVSLKE